MTGPAATSERQSIASDSVATYQKRWIQGTSADYSRDYAIDIAQLTAFLQASQPELADSFDLANASPTRRKFLSRLQGEITRRGTIDVLRNGIKDGPHEVPLFYGTPSSGNRTATKNYAKNRFSITRQLHYSQDATRLSLDLCIFINGLPIATFELKNNLTKQTVEDAVEQYRRDRDPKELLFKFGRCVVHFALDDQEVRFCTHLTGKSSWFLPFNKGYNDGAGNPPNPNGIKTDYLWRQILTPYSLTNILENYAQIVEEKDEKTGKKKKKQIFPRYHQLNVVRSLLLDARIHGPGKRYLIQHSAGSGKSNSIAWLTHQLAGIEQTGIEQTGEPLFSSILVITDRRLLDKQIRKTIKQFVEVGATVGAVTKGSKQLREFIEDGKKIIISTVQKFPFILEELGSAHRGKNFAIVIDEAHSSQGGRTASAMSAALSESGSADADETPEDRINRIMESRQMLTNASYFAFTATPKNKTLELFGIPYTDEGKTKHRPFRSYTMKQAVQEGFILDVLEHYTPVNSYYRLVKTIENDPEFDTKRAKKKLRQYVESNDHAIQLKTEIMVDHFHEQVIALNKIGGQARAMVVTSGIARAIQYFHAFGRYLSDRKSPYKAIVAFSGEHDYGGNPVTETTLNGFPSSKIADQLQEDPYRFLICADKFQTGYDEPLLHTMYVDKQLSSIKAVQTLSRLNRAHPKKHDVFVLDFLNDVDTIQSSFADFYRTTILSDETDPNKLHDLKGTLDGYQVYTAADVDELVNRYLDGAARDRLDPILDACVAIYIQDLDEDEQIDFKGKAKAFCRTYGFLASILPYTNADWEKLSIFLTFLTPKLPAPREEDLSRGILEAIDMDSYRSEKQATIRIQLPDAEAEIDPIPVSGGGFTSDPELERLSNILQGFNDQFGNINWTDSDRIQRLITEDIPRKVAADPAFQNAMQNSDEQNARIEHGKVLRKVVIDAMKDDTELFKQFSDNESFRRWLTNTVFSLNRTLGNDAEKNNTA
ncbi:MAG: type I restriction endonuclease [Cyanobacteria bacterium J06634_6]